MAISPSVVWKHSLSSTAASVIVPSEARLEAIQPSLEERRDDRLRDKRALDVRKKLRAPFHRTAGTIGLDRKHSGVGRKYIAVTALSDQSGGQDALRPRSTSSASLGSTADRAMGNGVLT